MSSSKRNQDEFFSSKNYHKVVQFWIKTNSPKLVRARHKLTLFYYIWAKIVETNRRKKKKKHQKDALVATRKRELNNEYDLASN